MPHAVWSGAISFGLVTIPIKVTTATEESRGGGEHATVHDMPKQKAAAKKTVAKKTGAKKVTGKKVTGKKAAAKKSSKRSA
ncbi:hypothetical protein OHU25_32340 [Streptomyces sp. NBC_00117]|uniref:hypothetical protein n=1 Tax=unclassified Streptomyces TaxID=2593676 RepID=UPI003244AA73